MFLIIGAVIAVVGLLAWLQAQHVRRVAGERLAILQDVQEVLDQPHLEQRGIDYPVLTGRYASARVTVRLIPDALALRLLPTLWLSVTMHKPLAVRGPVDILLRPSTTDIVSPGARFPREHAVPPDWPVDLRLATPTGVLPSWSALSGALPLLHDPLTKDLLLAPAGARIVTRLARAEVGPYRLARRVKFEARLSEERLVAVLESLRELTDRLDARPASRS